ncbi:hypothetical protein DFH11DRAFT_782574 [Phellopilus nigrolimitatus]|nr:hypothetical protein DFH11DRAFT_782574 [Phellopilus nigrolimitatus]
MCASRRKRGSWWRQSSSASVKKRRKSDCRRRRRTSICRRRRRRNVRGRKSKNSKPRRRRKRSRRLASKTSQRRTSCLRVPPMSISPSLPSLIRNAISLARLTSRLHTGLAFRNLSPRSCYRSSHPRPRSSPVSRRRHEPQAGAQHERTGWQSSLRPRLLHAVYGRSARRN